MYGMSVLLKNPDKGQGEKSYMIHHLPWLIGSLGTLALDLLVSFKEKKKSPLLPGLWILLNPKYMLHFGQCWACREDTSLNWFWSHDCVCWNTICSIKGPNTHREIGLLPALKQECKELYWWPLEATKGVDWSIKLLTAATAFNWYIDEADKPGESFYWTLIGQLKACFAVTLICFKGILSLWKRLSVSINFSAEAKLTLANIREATSETKGCLAITSFYRGINIQL